MPGDASIAGFTKAMIAPAANSKAPGMTMSGSHFGNAYCVGASTIEDSS
jgi:hypothetical protein